MDDAAPRFRDLTSVVVLDDTSRWDTGSGSVVVVDVVVVGDEKRDNGMEVDSLHVHVPPSPPLCVVHVSI